MQKWTNEQLRIAVTESRNVSQTLRRLGLRPVGGNYDTLRRRIAELHIDTSHWGRITPYVVEQQTLLDAVSASDSIASALRRIGWPDTTTTRKRFRALVELYGIETAHFLGQASQRGKQCPQRVRPASVYLVVGGPVISTTGLRRKLIGEGLFEPVCSSCNLTTWLGCPIPLELDHINGDRHDNRLENLRLLCPNCHALTPTYRGRNVGRYNQLSA
jgi:hypothetical protein